MITATIILAALLYLSVIAGHAFWYQAKTDAANKPTFPQLERRIESLLMELQFLNEELDYRLSRYQTTSASEYMHSVQRDAHFETITKYVKRLVAYEATDPHILTHVGNLEHYNRYVERRLLEKLVAEMLKKRLFNRRIYTHHPEVGSSYPYNRQPLRVLELELLVLEPHSKEQMASLQFNML